MSPQMGLLWPKAWSISKSTQNLKDLLGVAYKLGEYGLSSTYYFFNVMYHIVIFDLFSRYKQYVILKNLEIT